MTNRVPPANMSTIGCADNCLERSDAMLLPDAFRVTIIPVAVDTNNAGIWLDNPSPMVASVYFSII